MSVKRGKGIVLLVNKWDLIDKNTNTARDFSEEIRQRLAPFKDVPILFISAQEKQRIYQAINTISEVIKRRKLRIETSKLNELIKILSPSNIRQVTEDIKFRSNTPLKFIKIFQHSYFC